jgi:acetate kinase
MKVLVINSGSSSIKYQLFDMSTESLILRGRIEQIGSETALLVQQSSGLEEIRVIQEILNHDDAIRKMFQLITHPKHGVIGEMREIGAVGHRVVHGGESFTSEMMINEEVKKKIRQLYDLAPLHNPAHMAGILAVEEALPGVPQIAVFDTAFHQTMPQKAYLYPIPWTLYRKYGIRRYGFHGTSHEYVALQAARLVKKPLTSLKVITCHLGNGASCAAIVQGKSIDTSMGMTPLEGLMMGSRSGDIDPAIIPFLIARENLTVNEVSFMLNKHSGLLSISGIGSDVREIQEAALQGDEKAQLALDMYEYRIRKYIGAYVAAMNGIDLLVFTGGVGENSILIRKHICEQITYLGTVIDHTRNELPSFDDRIISTDSSTVTVLVIPTNEELMIAKKTYSLLTLLTGNN